MLEEPPPYAVFLLTANNRDLLPETIASRCVCLEILEIPDETMMNSIGSELKMVFKYGSLEKFYEATGYHDEN